MNFRRWIEDSIIINRRYWVAAIGIIALAFFISMIFATFLAPPANPTIRAPRPDRNFDAPMVVLGHMEARQMADHIVTTGKEDQTTEGIWYYYREFDAGKVVPPGADKVYDMKVFFIYVPYVAPGLHIGIEYNLREGPTDKWENHETRKVVQIKMDDADEDLVPNSMIRVDIEFHYGDITKYEYKSIDASSEWKHWLYFWYDKFVAEGMK